MSEGDQSKGIEPRLQRAALLFVKGKGSARDLAKAMDARSKRIFEAQMETCRAMNPGPYQEAPAAETPEQSVSAQ